MSQIARIIFHTSRREVLESGFFNARYHFLCFNCTYIFHIHISLSLFLYFYIYVTVIKKEVVSKSINHVFGVGRICRYFENLRNVIYEIISQFLLDYSERNL